MQYVLFSTGRASGLEARQGTIGDFLGTRLWQDIDCLPEGPKITETLRNGSYLLACPLQHLFAVVGRRGQNLYDVLLDADRSRWMVLFVTHDMSRMIGGRKSGTGGWLFWDLEDPSHILLNFALHLLSDELPEVFADDWLVGRGAKGQARVRRDRTLKALERVAAGDIDSLRAEARPASEQLAHVLQPLAHGPEGCLKVQEDIRLDGLGLVDFCLLSAVVSRLAEGNGLFSYGEDVLDTSVLAIAPALRQARIDSGTAATILERRGDPSTRAALESIDLVAELADLAEATLDIYEPGRSPMPPDDRTIGAAVADRDHPGQLEAASAAHAVERSRSAANIEVRAKPAPTVLGEGERDRLRDDIAAMVESATAYVDQRVEQRVERRVEQLLFERSRRVMEQGVERIVAERVDSIVAERLRMHEKRIVSLERAVHRLTGSLGAPPAMPTSAQERLLLLAIVSALVLLSLIAGRSL